MTGDAFNLNATLAVQTWQLLQHVPVSIFIFCFGACVGSFLNVVIYRLPAGMSVISPPSRCPTCGAKLKFFHENLPILGYFLVRGKCRYCGVRFSAQYMIIELLVALVFVGMYLTFYATHSSTPWWGQLGGVWWTRNGVFTTWPAFIALLFLIAGLIAMTVIDARTFIIPIQIPLFVTFTAFIAYAIQAIMPLRAINQQSWPIPALCWPGTLLAFGGMLGIAISYILLRAGKLRYSFADYANYLPVTAKADVPAISTEHVTPFELIFFVPIPIALISIGFFGAAVGVAIGIAAAIVMVLICRGLGITFGSEHEPNADTVLAPEYPHARREMKHELLYLLPCMVLGAMGLWIGLQLTGSPPRVVQAIGATFAGYLMGGGLIWGIRILGTLGFGREAMGMGDVHLLAAVGAVLGWFDSILIFFIAPFSGLMWAILSMGIASVFKRARRELPYGPHLAVATLVVVLCRPGLQGMWTLIMPNVPWPRAGLCEQAQPQVPAPMPAPVRQTPATRPVR